MSTLDDLIEAAITQSIVPQPRFFELMRKKITDHLDYIRSREEDYKHRFAGHEELTDVSWRKDIYRKVFTAWGVDEKTAKQLVTLAVLSVAEAK